MVYKPKRAGLRIASRLNVAMAGAPLLMPGQRQCYLGCFEQ